MNGERHARPRPTLLVSLALALAGAGCAAEQPSLGSLMDSATARVRRAPPDKRTRETTTALLAEPLSPEAAMRIALLNNRRVQAAYEKLGVARAEVVHALRLPNPSAEAALRFHGRGGPEIDLMAMIGLGELGLLPLKSDVSDAELEAERLEVIAFIVDLAFDVRVALIEVQAAEQTLELLQTVLAATQASADAAARLHEAGNLTDLDLATERAFSEEAKVTSRQAETARSNARARLSALMGLAAGTTWTVRPRLADPPGEELSVDGLEARAVAQSLDLAIAKQRAHAAEKRATLARVESLVPELKAGIAAERSGEWGVGPAASIELPLFYQGQGAVDAARAEMRRQAALYAQLGIEVRNAARAAGARLRATRANALEYRDVLLPLRQRVLDETELAYNAMAVGVFQLLQAKRAEVETARTYVDLLREYWQARANVERLEAGRTGSLEHGGS